MRLRSKFTLIMLGAFVVGLALAAAISYSIVERNARREVVQDAFIMMQSASAIRTYTSSEIRPLLAEQMKVKFLPHSVPSWAAQTSFHAFQKDFPNYFYKEATLNPTNLADRAQDWEADIINAFRNDPQLTQYEGERETPTGRVLTLARPLQIKDEACLSCHSTAAEAPATMIAVYGSANGFGWELNEVVGAQIVTVPMAEPLKRAQSTFMLFLIALTVVFAMMVLLINLMLQVFVVRPVTAISASAERVSMGDMDAPEYQATSKDEIGSLASSFNRMRRSLANAMKMLEG